MLSDYWHTIIEIGDWETQHNFPIIGPTGLTHLRKQLEQDVDMSGCGLDPDCKLFRIYEKIINPRAKEMFNCHLHILMSEMWGGHYPHKYYIENIVKLIERINDQTTLNDLANQFRNNQSFLSDDQIHLIFGTLIDKWEKQNESYWELIYEKYPNKACSVFSGLLKCNKNKALDFLENLNLKDEKTVNAIMVKLDLYLDDQADIDMFMNRLSNKVQS
jgi:hypothetical protein